MRTGRRYIKTIRAGSQRMAALIDDLLTFSRLSRQSLNRQTVDMNTLARRAAAEVLESQPGAQTGRQHRGVAAGTGDPALLRQVWTNLIQQRRQVQREVGHSRGADPGGSRGPPGALRSTGQRRWFRHEVRGQAVRRVSTMHSMDEYPGTGVGLAIVQRIINRHAGAVTAKG